MTDIQPIKSLRTQMAEAETQRSGSQRKLELAQTCMQKAIERNMEPALVKRALDFYSEIINESPELSQPYLAIAYLSWKLGEHAIAARFLNSLLALNPMSFQARELLEQIQDDAQRFKQK